MTNRQKDTIALRVFEFVDPRIVKDNKFLTAWGYKTKEGFLNSIKAIIEDVEVKA